MFTQHTESQIWNRMMAFIIFTFSSGIGLGPLVKFALHVNPSTLPAALLGTAIIFVAFTFAALLTRKRVLFYLGGILGTAIGVISTFSLMNLFIRSPALFNAELYLSFLIFCGFVVYDTQLIVLKRQLGDTDFVRHALDLFVDVIELFRHLLIILNSKRERNERNRESLEEHHRIFILPLRRIHDYLHVSVMLIKISPKPLFGEKQGEIRMSFDFLRVWLFLPDEKL
ncbi:hypothetical protein ACTXT7_000759 [Hymenolepis weldensis]